MKRARQLTRAGVLGALLAVAAGCGGDGSSPGNGSDPPPDPRPNPTSTITGTVRSANGDPIPFAAVYVPAGSVGAAQAQAKARVAVSLKATDQEACLASIPADALARTCSDELGNFSLGVGGITGPVPTLTIRKGALVGSVPVNCTTAVCALSAAATTLTTINTEFPKVAVVTGVFDRIENVLAKIGDADAGDAAPGAYGRVDAAGQFVYGSEIGSRLTMIAGGGVDSHATAQGSAAYAAWSEYLDGTRPLVNADGSLVFEVVFINCGNISESSLEQPAVRDRLRAYVEAGGRLYVTDQSYDFVEQLYPEAVSFLGDPDASTAGPLDAAEQGESGLTVNGNVALPALKTWLGSVRVNSNDGATPGNPNNAVVAGQVNGALAADGTIPLGDFLGGWGVIGSAPAQGATTVMVDSGASVVEGMAGRPLTFVHRVGTLGGRLLYSSYHTAAEAPSPGFWPQERVLQFLILQSY